MRYLEDYVRLSDPPVRTGGDLDAEHISATSYGDPLNTPARLSHLT